MIKRKNITMTLIKIKNALLLLACAFMAVTAVSCNDGKSYSDLLEEEEKAVNWYLAQNRVVPYVPADSVFETGPDAPYYRMNSDGTVYMRVIRTGDMNDRPVKGATVYFRFMRSNIKLLKEGTASDVGNSENMDSALGGESIIFGNTVLPSTTRWGEGLQVPLHYLGYNCEVDLIVKSVEGRSDEISECNPYVYKSLKFFKAEY